MGPFRKQVLKDIKQQTGKDMTWEQAINWLKDKIPELYEIFKNDLNQDELNEIPPLSFMRLGKELQDRNNITSTGIKNEMNC